MNNETMMYLLLRKNPPNCCFDSKSKSEWNRIFWVWGEVEQTVDAILPKETTIKYDLRFILYLCKQEKIPIYYKEKPYIFW